MLFGVNRACPEIGMSRNWQEIGKPCVSRNWPPEIGCPEIAPYEILVRSSTPAASNSTRGVVAIRRQYRSFLAHLP